MASPSSKGKIKEYLFQIYDDEKWSFNSKLLCSAGLFAGSILFIRSFGELTSI